MWLADQWKDYELLDTSCGDRLERWGKYILVRPDPQAIWQSDKVRAEWKRPNAIYRRSNSGGGHWDIYNLPEMWKIGYRDLTFQIKPMNFKHTGIFPEQAVNWDFMSDLIQKANRPIKVLNLFAYTGGATMACAKAGASVVHVDASKGMVQWAKENAVLCGVADRPIRYLVDDCMKFVEREIRRGNTYDGIIMDPPSYGRGPSGEMWKIENDLYNFVQTCRGVLVDKPLFVPINSYTTGLQPMVLKNILELTMKSFKGRVEAYEVGIKTEEGIPLPCGAGGMFIYDEN